MCQDRLGAGEAPACVQACPTQAIRIVKRNVAEVITEGRAGRGFLTGAPSPRSTLPTTRYTGRFVPATAKPADQEALIPQHTHLPLTLMLSLTQAGLGLAVAAAFTHSLAVGIAGIIVFMTGMAASILHLGRPLGAWRFFLGLRTSWLSREILAFSMVAPLVMAGPALHFVERFIPPKLMPYVFMPVPGSLAAMSVIAVFTSVMIYVDTHRSTWRFPITGTKFFGTLLIFTALGFALSQQTAASSLMVAGAIVAKLLPEIRFLKKGAEFDEEPPWTPDRHMARLQLQPLHSLLATRMTLALLAIFLVASAPWMVLGLLLVSETLERALFFRSVYAPKMTGGYGPIH
jgi:DMSO reductase anchor subunit